MFENIIKVTIMECFYSPVLLLYIGKDILITLYVNIFIHHPLPLCDNGMATRYYLENYV